MSDNNDAPSNTISKIAEDYLHPGEKIKVPQHAIDAISGNSSQPEELTYEAERAPDIEVDEHGNIREVLVEPESSVVDNWDDGTKPAIIEPAVQLSDVPPEELTETIPMKEEDHSVVAPVVELEEPATPVVESPLDVAVAVAQQFANSEQVTSDKVSMEGVVIVDDVIVEATDEQLDVLMEEESMDTPIEELPPYVPPKQNFSVKWEPKFADKKAKTDRNLFTELSVLGGGLDEFNHQAQQSDDNNKFDSDDDRMFLAYLKEAAALFHEYRSFDKSLTRENSQWEQAIMSDVGPLALSRPNFGKSNNPNLTGEKAILKMSSIMNLGQLMSVPLWHSGIWIKLKAPSDAALLALENRIAEEKVMLGRQTNGFIFSNSSAYIYDYLINLILSCVYDVTYVKQTTEDLKKIIKISDIPTLVWGFLCTIYPNGYPIAQPCINNIGNCNHIEHEMVSISKLMWVDKSALTPAQIKHMSKRDAKVTEEEIKKYQDDLQLSGDKLVEISDKLSFLLSVPTIQEYIDSGYKWVEGIERMVAGSFAASKQGDERNEYILAMSKTMALRQYAHWIKEIRLQDDPTDPDGVEYIKDRDTLEEAMDTLSKDVDLGETILIKITEYIDSTTMSVVGIPRYLCPACNTDQGKFLPDDRYIIPLDIIRIFFTLQSQRLLKVTLSMSE